MSTYSMKRRYLLLVCGTVLYLIFVTLLESFSTLNIWLQRHWYNYATQE